MTQAGQMYFMRGRMSPIKILPKNFGLMSHTQPNGMCYIPTPFLVMGSVTVGVMGQITMMGFALGLVCRYRGA